MRFRPLPVARLRATALLEVILALALFVVAAAIVSMWPQQTPARSGAVAAPAASEAGTLTQQPTRKTKPQRKARAS